MSRTPIWSEADYRRYCEKNGIAPESPPKRRSTKKSKTSSATDWFVHWCPHLGLPAPTPEYQFHPTRKWRFDYAWPEHHVYLEVEGGTKMKGGGRHNRGPGFEEDMRKYNAAAELGWTMIRVLPGWLPGANKMRIDGDVYRQLQKLLLPPSRLD